MGDAGLSPRKKTGIAMVDIAVLSLISAWAAFIILRITDRPELLGNWALVSEYLFRYDPLTHRYVPNMIIQGFLTTLRLSIWSMILATAGGMVMAIFRISPSLFRRMIGRTYVELVRNVPPLVLVFIVYYFMSDQILGRIDMAGMILRLSPDVRDIISLVYAPPEQVPLFTSALFSLALYEGAYITEIIRAGVQSIDRGQWEASAALGLRRREQLLHVIFPQAFPRILPPLAGQLISAVKDSAIVSVISIQELTFQGMEIMSATYLTFEIWTTVAGLYFILAFALSLGVRQMEKRIQKERL